MGVDEGCCCGDVGCDWFGSNLKVEVWRFGACGFSIMNKSLVGFEELVLEFASGVWLVPCVVVRGCVAACGAYCSC